MVCLGYIIVNTPHKGNNNNNNNNNNARKQELLSPAYISIYGITP